MSHVHEAAIRALWQCRRGRQATAQTKN